MQKKVIIIGSGFSGMSAACFMAKAGWQVQVIEKHNIPGGRARNFEAEGFTFDMGPSWYWMPDVFERFFKQFGKSVDDYYKLKRLDPSYRVYWPDRETDIPADYDELKKLFDAWEEGAGDMLDKFMQEAEYKYSVGINKLVFKPGRSLIEFIDKDLVKGIVRLDVFSSMKTHVARYFKHPRLRELMEFPVLFLGALPKDTPALYSLMNYADIKGGTWFPEGGMYSVVDGIYKLSKELGVQYLFDHAVYALTVEEKQVKQVVTDKGVYSADIVVASADYEHVENRLLTNGNRSYTDKYWDSRKMAPSCLLYFVGLKKKLNNLRHHSLFFDVPFQQHAHEIYEDKQWPTEPLFYVSATSVTDETLAPAGCENLFILIPVAAGLTGDDEALRERYFEQVITRLEKRIGESIQDSIVYKKTYATSNFIEDYNSFKGNAYGLANTLKQTALLKPAVRSRKVKNLFYTGQLTVPGPGVPPSLISGEVVAGEVLKHF